MVVGGGILVVGGGPREATDASSRVQILARQRKSSPLTTPPGPLKLRLFGNKYKHIFVYLYEYISLYIDIHIYIYISSCVLQLFVIDLQETHANTNFIWLVLPRVIVYQGSK